MALPSGPTTSVRCPRCEASFGCAAGTWGCWCREAELTDELRARLAAKYVGCLCGRCLRELAARP